MCRVGRKTLTQSQDVLFAAVVDVVRLLLAKEKKDREEAEKKKLELEEELNRYSTQYENTQQGFAFILDQLSATFAFAKYPAYQSEMCV